LMKLTLTLILVLGTRYVRSGRNPLASGSMGIQVGVLSCWETVQEGTSFLPSSSGREFKEEEFIGTLGCKSSSQGRCTLYNHQDGWMGRHSMSGNIE